MSSGLPLDVREVFDLPTASSNAPGYAHQFRGVAPVVQETGSRWGKAATAHQAAKPPANLLRRKNQSTKIIAVNSEIRNPIITDQGRYTKVI